MRNILTSTLSAAFLVAAGAAHAQPTETTEPLPEQTAPVEDEAAPVDSADEGSETSTDEGQEGATTDTTTADDEPAEADQTL